VPLWLVVAWFARPAFASTAPDLAFGTLAAILGATVNYIWGYNLALLAFWFTRTDAIAQFWFGMSLFFGGRIAPLSIIPVPLQWVASVLPFQWMIYFPTIVLIGGGSTEILVRGFVMQGFWLLLGLAVFRLMWREAVRRYSAVGA
jgi:ABC-2 type transport system permease protein